MLVWYELFGMEHIEWRVPSCISLSSFYFARYHRNSFCIFLWGSSPFHSYLVCNCVIFRSPPKQLFKDRIIWPFRYGKVEFRVPLRIPLPSLQFIWYRRISFGVILWRCLSFRTYRACSSSLSRSSLKQLFKVRIIWIFRYGNVEFRVPSRIPLPSTQCLRHHRSFYEKCCGDATLSIRSLLEVAAFFVLIKINYSNYCIKLVFFPCVYTYQIYKYI